MPKAQEKALREVVNKTYPNYTEEQKNAFVYGIMREEGWKPKRELKKKK